MTKYNKKTGQAIDILDNKTRECEKVEITMEMLYKDLEHAKEAVESMLKDSGCSVDMHGIEYWAGRVERLRDLIKNSL